MSTSAMDTTTSSNAAIDSNLYSRQLYVLGVEGQARMQQSNVLIIGLRGVGVEVAKDLILMGVKSVTLFDPAPTQFVDLSSQFYLTPEDVGKPRDAQSVAKLQELNQLVAVNVLASSSTTLSEAQLSNFDVVVCTDVHEAEALRINAITRSLKKKFILGETRGVFGRVFSDFGDTFHVADINDENAATAQVVNITSEENGLVTIEGKRHGLQDGDVVKFTEVQGMTGLNEENGAGVRKVRVKNATSFYIGDTRGMEYVRGGIVMQVKQPADISFKPLKDMTKPVGQASGPGYEEVLVADDGKYESTYTLHTIFSSFHKYLTTAPASSLPSGAAAADVAASLIELTQAEMGAENALNDAQKGVITQFARCAAGQLVAMTASIGGITAQEVIKSISGKHMPIRQWLYIDAVEALPALDAPLSASEVELTGTRYDGQIAVFGRTMQAKIGNLKYFLVGAGAIGCETLKNWALMGVGCGPEGSVVITDMDRIEKSNLSRQFLFRSADIGNAKSGTAAAAAKRMNPDLHITAMEIAVGSQTESTFDDAFWTALDGVCTALDNVDARLYVDSRCVQYGKPLLESGTLGTKGNTQVVVPRLTENYGATTDPPEEGIPACTLKNFPFKPEHTLQWARNGFEEDFRQIADTANSYLTQPTFLEVLAGRTNERISTLETLHEALVTARPTKMEDCVAWARLRFQENFHNMIKQLLFNFPADSKGTDNNPFWSGSKRCPVPLVFDSTDPTHMSYITTTTQLRASLYGLKLTASHTPEWFKTAVEAVHVPTFEARAGVKIAANEKEAEEMQKAAEAAAAANVGAGGGGGGGGNEWDTETIAKSISDKLPAPSSVAGFRMFPVEFEKDDDLHVAFITAASNLRSRIYRIDEVDQHKAKGIAGKIIPAIATTTAMVTGFICMELYKLLSNKSIGQFRCCFGNLAIPIFSFAEPTAVSKTVMKIPKGAPWLAPPVPGSGAATAATLKEDGSYEWEWSVWDCFDLTGPMTMGEVINFFKTQVMVEPYGLAYGTTSLMDADSVKKLERRLKTNVVRVATVVSTRPLHPTARYITLEVLANAIGGTQAEDVEMPRIRYRLSADEIAAIGTSASGKE